jgi:predicted DNA-binding protein (MmcQ/YjbR family)
LDLIRGEINVAHPRKYEESNELISQLRQVCLAFAGVVEKEAWGECTFRITGGKMFAMTDNDHHHSGHLAVWVMAPPTAQEALIRSKPERFFKPPYVGVKGWVGVRLDKRVDWDQLAAILREGYLMSAPAKLPSRKGAAKSTARYQPRVRRMQPGTGRAKSRAPHRPNH